MIKIRAFKKKEKEGERKGGERRTQLGGQWKVPMFGGPCKVPSLLANGRFQVWWPLEGSKFGSQWGSILFGGQWKVSMLIGPWKVPSLVAFGRRRRKKNIIFTSFHFPPNKFYLNLFFPLILMFYFTMILNCYFTPFLHFLCFINCNHTSRCTKFSTHSLLS
jgi:hypothetical protein